MIGVCTYDKAKKIETSSLIALIIQRNLRETDQTNGKYS